jgi:hypothetical protein
MYTLLMEVCWQHQFQNIQFILMQSLQIKVDFEENMQALSDSLAKCLENQPNFIKQNY